MKSRMQRNRLIARMSLSTVLLILSIYELIEQGMVVGWLIVGVFSFYFLADMIIENQSKKK